MTTTARDWRAIWDREPYSGGDRKAVLTDPLAALTPSERVRGSMEMRVAAERDAAMAISAAADRAAHGDPAACRAQHLAEDVIREVPADAAGEFKRIVPSPLDTYASRNQITPEQRAAGRLLHDDYAVGVFGVRDCDDVDPSLRIPQSQSPGMPPTQVLAGLRYMDAIAAVTDGSKLVTRAVCCDELTITAIVGRSARKRQRAMTVLLVGLQDLVAYYAGEGRL